MNAPVLEKFCPSIPADILTNFDGDDLRIRELWELIFDELQDASVGNRKHGNPGTYEAGCHKFLCRKARTERQMRKDRPLEKTFASWPEDALIGYLKVIAEMRITSYRHKMLQGMLTG